MPIVPAHPSNTFDQAPFLDQLKEFARGFIQWIQEEGQEAEHPVQGGTTGGTIDQSPQGSITPGGGAVPMPSAPHEAEQVQPLLMRTRTTTVHDFGAPGSATPGAATPGAGTPTAPTQQMASDPPVSQAQRGAMHAAAAGNSTLGIPSSVGKEFANADPGGKLPSKVADDGPGGAERFSLSPDGRVVDAQSGKSYSMEEVAQILFGPGGQGGQQQDTAPNSIQPAGVIPISQPNTEVNTAQWSSPRVDPPGKDRLGDGDGGKVLGQLLKFTSGGQGGQTGEMPPRGGLAPDHGSWRSPAFARDYGTSEGAQKRGQGGAVKQAAAPRPQAPQKPAGTWHGPGASREDAANYEAQERNRRAR